MHSALGAPRALEECPKPVIAAVHGDAVGGGCELTIVCDIVVADATARFATHEAALGLVPGLAVARGRGAGEPALDEVPRDDWASARRGAGPAGRACERRRPPGEHLAEAECVADVIARRSGLALAAGERLLNRHGGERYAHAEDAVSLLQSAPDFAEGVAAFAERRQPRFGG
jgi:enoyl-CoA hydratase